MDRYNLIGISGKMGSGKTTLAMDLIKLYPNYQKKSFAEKPRNIVAYMTNTTFNKTTYLPKYDKTMSLFLQEFATHVRNVEPDIWVHSLFADWANDSLWIIDDVRFPNEADEIRRRGGILIRLRDTFLISEDGRDKTHISETALDDYKFDIVL